MVKYYKEPLDYVFFALADCTRRRMLVDLKKGYKTAQELAAPFTISLPAISKHLKILEKARLLKREIRGRQHYFHLQSESFRSVTDWTAFFEEFWSENLDNLSNFLEETQGEEK